MGARGPQATPNVLKLIAGNPGKRPINLADGISPAVNVPAPPPHLGKDARKEWRRITVELEALGVISSIDRAALALYCEAWGDLVLLTRSRNARIEALEDAGEDPAGAWYFTTDKGYQALTVTSQQINALRDQVHRYLKAFGMDPSSRTRVTPTSQQQALPGFEQPWAQFATN